MITITMLLARMMAFPNQGFMGALPSSQVLSAEHEDQQRELPSWCSDLVGRLRHPLERSEIGDFTQYVADPQQH